jgi:uncharacterized protein YdeI (YjbR/CyaY-like superfamily)
MGVLGRIRSLEDLPSSRILAGYIKQAMALDAAGPGAADRPRPSPKPLPKVPTALTAALQKNARARKFFAALPPGHRREYLDWIVGAKQEATRDRRVATAVQWLAEGKHHNWRYEAGKGATKTRPKPAASAKRKSAARKPASKRAAVRPGGR